MGETNILPKVTASWSGGEYHEPADQLLWCARLNFKCPICQRRHMVKAAGKGALPETTIVQCKTTKGDIEIEFLK
jgi:hypothetical protein